MSRAKTLASLSLLCLVGLTIGQAWGTEFRGGQVVHIRDTEILDDVVATGDDINIDAHILGDVIAAARTVSLGDSGTVDNSLMAFGQKVEVNGHVLNSVRGFAQDVTVRGHVEGNVMTFSQSALIDSRSWVEKDLTAFGGQVIVRGRIGGNARMEAEKVTISGQIDGDVKVGGKHVVVLNTAIIGGKLRYPIDTDVKIDEGAQILGGVEEYDPDEGKEHKGYTFGSFVWDCWWYLGSLAIGLVILVLFKGFMSDLSRVITNSSVRTLGIGILFLVGMPIAAVATLLTLIGIPAAVLLLVVWMVLLYLADVFVGRALGDWILPKLRGGRAAPAFLSLALGLLVITLLGAVPYLGTLVNIIVAGLALGGFFIVAYNRRTKAA